MSLFNSKTTWDVTVEFRDSRSASLSFDNYEEAKEVLKSITDSIDILEPRIRVASSNGQEIHLWINSFLDITAVTLNKWEPFTSKPFDEEDNKEENSNSGD